MKKRAAALCGIAVALTGTLTALPHSATATPSATAADVPTATTLRWKACGTGRYPELQCASLDVPLDHADPDGRRITLALSRVPHTAKSSQGPLLVNPGGPGGSGLSLAGHVARELPAEVAAQYDVIGFDPRGVGKSEPALDCLPGHFDPVRPPSVPDTPAVEEANTERARAFARACGEKHGDVLPYIDTLSTVRDVEAVRAALGAPQISYLGYSYGTYLGSVYATLYPQRVRRMALDSVVDPDEVWYEANLGQDTAFQARHQAFLAWIARHDAVYGLGTDPARIEEAWYAMRTAVTREPAGGTVGGAELEDTFLPGAYFDGYWPYLAEAFAAYTERQDPDVLVAAYEAFGTVDAEGDNGYSAYTAVQCRDAWWTRDWDDWRADNRRTHTKAPFSTWNNAWYNAPCAHWPTAPLAPPNVGTDDLPPVLLLQASDDGATPVAGAYALRRALGGSRLVVEEGGGNHGVTLSGNTCLDRHLSDYLATGRVPDGPGTGAGADAVCARLPEPEPRAPRGSAAARGAALHGLLGFRG
ncbi:alpha/beta hydrolase [Streptomyces sp. NPDC127068]|uniref:alpha/beta hydrolase n=1 Tax=Streptomyces sp. NPDC127068 TaxID=3347127 RepID=UPI00364EA9BB